MSFIEIRKVGGIFPIHAEIVVIFFPTKPPPPSLPYEYTYNNILLLFVLRANLTRAFFIKTFATLNAACDLNFPPLFTERENSLIHLTPAASPQREFQMHLWI